jgi:hypothetical protein
MASTRLNNSKGEYCLQQRGYNRALDFELYKFKCIPSESAFPGLGVNMPMMTNGFNNNVLSRNASDVESALFGINSTNLVNARAPVHCKINTLPTKNFFPLPKRFIPEPLVVETCQRPSGPFC